MVLPSASTRSPVLCVCVWWEWGGIGSTEILGYGWAARFYRTTGTQSKTSRDAGGAPFHKRCCWESADSRAILHQHRCPAGYAQSLCEQLSKMTFPCGTCSWRHILDGCTGARVEMGRGQSGYLHVYPFLLPLRDAGATGLAGVLCPRGNTPLLQQGEPDTHRQHQESHSGTSGGGNGGRKENREQSYLS